VLELGKAGSAGHPRGEAPVLRDGAPVALLRASNWKEEATAVVGDREWTFTKRRGELLGRWAAEQQDAVRLRASKTSLWRGTWSVDLEGRLVEVRPASFWNSTHRFFDAGRQVATSGSTGGWSPRPTFTADGSLPLHHQVFLLWMELVLARRNASAAGAGAAVSVTVIGGIS
jgi:hypothetical protein